MSTFNAFVGSVIEDLKGRIDALEDIPQVISLGNRVTTLERNVATTMTTVSTNGLSIANLKNTVEGIKNRPTEPPPPVDEKSKTWYEYYLAFEKSIYNSIK